MRTGARAGRFRSATIPPPHRRSERNRRSPSAPARRPASAVQSSRAHRRVPPSRCPARPTAAPCCSRRAGSWGCASPGGRISVPPRPGRRIPPSRSAPSGSDRRASDRIHRVRRLGCEAGPAPPPDRAGAGNTARRRAYPPGSRDRVRAAGTACLRPTRFPASLPVSRSRSPLPRRARCAADHAPRRPRARAPVRWARPASGGSGGTHGGCASARSPVIQWPARGLVLR